MEQVQSGLQQMERRGAAMKVLIKCGKEAD
jgi:hypothetical protein